MSALKNIVQVPYMFLLLNWAAVAGLYYYAQGHQNFWNVSPLRVKATRLAHVGRP